MARDSIKMSFKHDLYPLSVFCAHEDIQLPSYRVLPSSEVPTPYHGLLVHPRDMTSVLRDYYGQDLHLESVQLRHEKKNILRRVTLVTEDGHQAEFGAIAIDLSLLPIAAHQDVLDCHIPFGKILERYKIDYISQTRGFIEIEPNHLIGEALRMNTSAKLYGRMNVLCSIDNEVMARVVEILPLTRDED